MKTNKFFYSMLFFVLACQTPVSNKNPSALPISSTKNMSKTSTEKTRNKTPEKEFTFNAGPKRKPAASLLKWLQNEASTEKRILIPVLIRFTDAKLGIQDAFIGVSEKERNHDAIFLSLDDSTMGISLMDLLQSSCPKESVSCAVWLEGYWGSPMPAITTEENTWPFTVRKLNKTFQESSETPGRIYIETSS